MILPKKENSKFASSDHVPVHVAIIMDGNRRWAREHKLPVLEGHRRVAGPVLEKLIAQAVRRGIKILTLWAFSTENWEREKTEVAGIMQILRQGFGRYGAKMHRQGIRIRVIGDLTKLEPDLQKSINGLVELTRNNTRITVVFALNYGGRDELVRSFNRYLLTVNKGKPELTPEVFSNFLDTAGLPEPDLVVRTGGEQRLSGFLPWQSVYAELYFPDFYMPDFTPERLDEAIAELARRKRRFGK